MQEQITILIADDHEITRQGVRNLLEQTTDLKVVGEAQDGSEIKELVERYCPKILLLDLVMPNHSPVELERWVRQNHPQTVTLVLTGHDRDAYLCGMMAAGAAGYLDKKLRAGQLIAAIRRAADGEYLFDRQQQERARCWREQVSQKWDRLSDREREVLQMLTEGAKNKTIAETLNIQVHTAEKHLQNIYKKLGVKSRAQAVRWWLESNT